MAFSFQTQVSANGAISRSPIIFEVTESTANDDYKYILDVYINDSQSVPATGTYDYRLVCSPDASNTGKFDVSKIVNGELEPNYGINNASLTSRKDIGTGSRYLYCRGGFIDDSGTVNANEAATTIPVRCYQGYSYFDDIQNTTIEAAGQVFTSMPQSNEGVIKIPTSAIYYYPVQRDILSTASFVTDDGTTGTIALGSTATPASEATRYVPVGTRQLTLPDEVRWYDVTFTDVGANDFTYRFEVTCEPKYDYYTLMFLNRYGVWDYIYFFKRSQESINVDREEYKRINPTQIYRPEYRRYNVNGRESITLNTGFVDEAFNVVYKELMLSEHILLVEKNGVTIEQPLTLEDSELTFQTGVNDQLINYTMTFNKAYSAINKRW